MEQVAPFLIARKRETLILADEEIWVNCHKLRFSFDESRLTPFLIFDDIHTKELHV